MTQRTAPGRRGNLSQSSGRSALERATTRARAQLRGRRGVAVALVTLTVGGAAAGALAGADPRPSGENAEVLLAVDPRWPAFADDSAAVTSRLRYIQGFERVPEVLAAAGHEAGVAPRSIAQRTEVQRDGDLAALRVSARYATVSTAQTVATALANEMAAAAQRSLRSAGSRTEVVGDFEAGNGSWAPLSSQATLPPTTIKTVTGSAYAGTAFLRVACRPTPGCGVVASTKRLIRARAPYRLGARARAQTGLPSVRLVLGAPPSDVAESREVRLDRSWRQIFVSWRPSRSAGSATLAVEVAGAGRNEIELDAVTIRAPQAPERRQLPSGLSRQLELRAVDKAQYVVVSSPTPTGTSGRLPAASTLAGAGAGLLIAVSGLATGAAAARRRERIEG